MAKAVATKAIQRGIAFWMERVVAEREKVLESFDSEAVHDLRVALRRCRSMAEGFQSVDGDPSWGKMRRSGKIVFAALGDLRDTQVMLEWIERLHDECPPVAERLKAHCSQREVELKESAAEAVNGFDAQRWLQWAQKLDGRVRRIGNSTEIFQVLALESFDAAHVLHAQALRNRSKTALHELRIGVKKLRYVVENFLSEQNRLWGADLKCIQDVLGEVHDLDVLWSTALLIHAFASLEERQHWYAAISRERIQRVNTYRDKMVGRRSLWQEWRSGLPSGELLHKAVLKRFEAWAESLDADPAHTHAVAHFSLQLYDALQNVGLIPARRSGAVKPRDLLQVAALTIGAGYVDPKAPHKASARLLQKLKPPPGWSVTDLLIAALVARYYRGALPFGQKAYAALSPEDQHLVDGLCGILRLAYSLDGQRDQAIRGISVNQAHGRFDIIADGYDPRSKQAEKIAAARHLLEQAFDIAFMVCAPGELQVAADTIARE
jgi:CHAD domain-containing protein